MRNSTFAVDENAAATCRHEVSAESRWLKAESGEQMEEGREQREWIAESREEMAYGREQRAESRVQRAESGEQREPRSDASIREQGAESVHTMIKRGSTPRSTWRR